MDDLQAIRSYVPAYADYGDEESRRLADDQVRAWVGEALSRLRERVGSLESGVAEQLDALLMTCGFADQPLMRTLDHITVADDDRLRLHAADRALFDLGKSADDVRDGAAVGPFLTTVRAGFTERAARIRAMHSAPPTH